MQACCELRGVGPESSRSRSTVCCVAHCLVSFTSMNAIMLSWGKLAVPTVNKPSSNHCSYRSLMVWGGEGAAGLAWEELCCLLPGDTPGCKAVPLISRGYSFLFSQAHPLHCCTGCFCFSFFPGTEVGYCARTPHGHLTLGVRIQVELHVMLVGCRNWCTPAGMCSTGLVCRDFLTASDAVPNEFSHAVCLAACHCCSNSSSGPLSLYCSWGVGMAGRPGPFCGLTAQQHKWLLPLLSPVRGCLLSPLAVGSLHAQPQAVGRVELSMIQPSLQGSLRQSLGKHSRGRQWYPGYLVLQFLFLGH